MTETTNDLTQPLLDRLDSIETSVSLLRNNAPMSADAWCRVTRAGAQRLYPDMAARHPDSTWWTQDHLDARLTQITEEARAHNTNQAAWLLRQAENALSSAVA